LDATDSERLDFYLVLTGPPSAAASSQGYPPGLGVSTRFLFDARQLRAEQIERGVKSGVASSVVKQQWEAAHIYPIACNAVLTVTSGQAEMLSLIC
jgi:hypothetical protein